MNWIKRLFGIKEKQAKTIEIENVDIHPDYYIANKKKPVLKQINTSNPVTSRRNTQVPVSRDNSSEDFAMSMIVAQMTDSALLGYVAGGSLTGAMIGDSLNDSDNTSTDSNDNKSYESDSNDYSHSNDSTSYDSGSSYDSDSSSSYDSGSSSSSDW